MANTIKALSARVGGLSQPSKMPGFAYGLPAWECKLGKILHKKAGSVCHSCYALKGMYSFPAVKAAQVRRMETLSSGTWVADMSELITLKYRKRTGRDRVFRWHDSGDIQSVEHLSMLVAVANNVPTVKFWLPTRERRIVADWQKRHGEFPSNLVVRISMPMVGQESPTARGTLWSTVGAGSGSACPARQQGNACGDCRVCWDKRVRSIDYEKH